MPIELWWWVSPLFLTGWIVFLFFGIAAIVVDAACNNSWVGAVLAMIAMAPWAVCVISVVVWLVTNILIVIWR